MAPYDLLWPNDFRVGRPWTASRNSSPNDLNAACRVRDARPERSCTTAGRTRVTRAPASITAATGTSQKAMKAKIATGAATAIATCGRYWPKNVCNCSTPSTMESMTPPVRSAPNQAGPRATILSYKQPPQRLLDVHGGAVRDHGAAVVQRRSQHDGNAGARQRPDERGGWGVLEHAGQEAAEEHEAGDAEHHGQQPQRHRQRNAPAIALGHAPERQVEMHRSGLLFRTLSCGAARRFANDRFSIAVDLDCTAEIRQRANARLGYFQLSVSSRFARHRIAPRRLLRRPQ